MTPPIRQVVDTTALHAAIDARRRELGLSWTQAVSQITGGSTPSLAARLRAGRAVSGDVLASIMIWLGTYDIRPFLVAMQRAGRRYRA